MASTATALADLRFGLRFAAGRYRRYACLENPEDNVRLFRSLADERETDANDLDHAIDGSGLTQSNPTFSDESVGPLLGMGKDAPHSAASAAYRVQRAENTLRGMAAQLGSLSPEGRLSDALILIREHIDRRRDEVRKARQAAHTFDLASKLTAASKTELSTHPMTSLKLANGQEVAVWFGTNRHRDRSGPFLGQRAYTVTYGMCRVFVPDDRTMGALGRGFFGRVLQGNNRVNCSFFFCAGVLPRIASPWICGRDG